MGARRRKDSAKSRRKLVKPGPRPRTKSKKPSRPQLRTSRLDSSPSKQQFSRRDGPLISIGVREPALGRDAEPQNGSEIEKKGRRWRKCTRIF